MKRFLPTLVVAFLPLIAFAQETPDALVKRVSDELLQLVRTDKALASGDQRKVIEVAEAKVLPHFDFERMTRLAVGRNWAQASEPQKQSLVKEFRTMLVRTYSSSLSAYRNQTIEVKPTKMTAADKDTTVRTAVIQPGGPPIPIDYAMDKAGDGSWKVYDVIVDGVSLVTTYRSSFNEQIQKGGIDGLVKTLADRNRSPEPPKPPAPAKK
jgi:phospholipid transport system substrate-binding protein